jgi:hypothetical protein
MVWRTKVSKVNKGPRPRSGKIEAKTYMAPVLGGKINWLGPKKHC